MGFLIKEHLFILTVPGALNEDAPANVSEDQGERIVSGDISVANTSPESTPRPSTSAHVDFAKRQKEQAEHVKEVSQLFPGVDAQHLHQFDVCFIRNCSSLSSPTDKDNKVQSKFRHEWLFDKSLGFCLSTEWNWCVYVEGQGMYCALCRKHKVQNKQNKSKTFVEEPSCRIRKATFKDHANSQQHKDAIEAEHLQRVSGFHKAAEKGKAVKDEVYFNAFYSVYWLAKNEVANRKTLSLLQLLEFLGLRDMKFFDHQSQRSIREIFLTLGQTVARRVLTNVQHAKAYGILLDEVTDISVQEMLLAFVQYFSQESGMTEVKFLFVKNLLEESESADSQTIFHTVTSKLEELNLKMDHCMSLVSDGASVMTGHRNGLAVKLKEVNKNMISFHCICHKLALACTDTLKELDYISLVQDHLRTLWKYFEDSPKRMAVFLKAQLALRAVTVTDGTKQRLVLRLKKACSTRWLSFDGSVNALYETYIPVVQTLAKQREVAVAEGLLGKVHCYKFVSTLYMLKEVLPLLATLSQVFQKGTLDFSHIAPSVAYCKSKLNEVKRNKAFLHRLHDDLQPGGRLGTAEITITPHKVSLAESLTEKYISALVKNIDARFGNCLPAVSAFSVFDPVHLPEPSQTSFADYGKTEMNVIGEQFFASLPNEDRATRKEKLQAEYGKFKYDLASWKVKIPPECQPNTERPPEITAMTWSLQKLAKMGHFYEELSFVAEIILSAPVTNAWPERGASALKRIKTRLRSKLGDDMMFSLMHITINGPELGTSESREMVEQAYEDWKSAKTRRYRSGPILNTPASSTEHEPPHQALPCVEMSDAGVQTEVESLGTSSATQPLAAAISETEALSILQLNDITDAECDTENDLDFDFSL